MCNGKRRRLVKLTAGYKTAASGCVLKSIETVLKKAGERKGESQKSLHDQRWKKKRIETSDWNRCIAVCLLWYRGFL
jgi:hypothetical protein